MRRRRVSARGVRRRSATTSPSTARRPSTASRCCRNFRSTRSTTACPATTSDDHARFIEAVVSTAQGALRVASIYLPNGNPPDTEKYTYKIGWMKRLSAYARERLALEEPLVMAGDYNVIPTAADARNPQAWTGDALFLPQHARRIPRADQSRPHRRGARDQRRSRPLYVLGLSGRRLAEEQRHPHRPPAAVAARRRQAHRRRHRPPCARPGRSRPITCRCGSIWISRRSRRIRG